MAVKTGTISAKEFLEGKASTKPDVSKVTYVIFDTVGNLVKTMHVPENKVDILETALVTAGHFAQCAKHLWDFEKEDAPPLKEQLIKAGWAFDENGRVVTKG